MNAKSKLNKFAGLAMASACLICGAALMQKPTPALAASKVSGTLTVVYHGLGKVRLLDQNGNYQNQYVAPNSRWKVWDKAQIQGRTMYRIGNEQQWIPAMYTNWNNKQAAAASATVPVTDILNNVFGQLTITYPGPGEVRLLNVAGQYQNQYVAPKSVWKVWAMGHLNGDLAYRIGNNNQWVPGKFVHFTFIKEMTLVNYQEAASAREKVNGTILVLAPAHSQVRLLNAQGDYQNQYVKNSQLFKAWETALINGQRMYRIGTDSQWIPSKFAKFIPASMQAKQAKPAAATTTSNQAFNPNWTQADIQAAEQEFVNYVNAWRQKQGLTPFKLDDGWLQAGALVRAQDVREVFQKTNALSHIRPDGSPYYTAFKSDAQLHGENVGFVGTTRGLSPKQAADEIAQAFIDEGPTGWHYQLIHANTDANPLIGVGFSTIYQNGMYNYLLNTETGTN